LGYTRENYKNSGTRGNSTDLEALRGQQEVSKFKHLFLPNRIILCWAWWQEYHHEFDPARCPDMGVVVIRRPERNNYLWLQEWNDEAWRQCPDVGMVVIKTEKDNNKKGAVLWDRAALTNRAK
jgi:hypothetical protein